MTRRTTGCISLLVGLFGACQRTNQPISFDDNLLAAETSKPLFAAAPGSPIAVAGMPGNVAIADVNGDGKPDLLVAAGKGKTISVLLGQGDGQFRPAAGSPIAVPDHPSEMVVRDLNGDGRPDLALGSHD